MKKLFLALAVVATGLFGSQAQAATIGEKLLFYIPNRIVDALDVVSIAVGIGPVVEARLMATRALDFGLGIGMTAKAYKIHNRQIGLGIEEGWYWSFIVGEESYKIHDTTPLVAAYTETCAGFPEPTQRVYKFYDGNRDYWAIGGSLGLLIDGDLYVHPVEFVDFILGFFLIDIKDDDFTAEDFE